MQAFFTVTPYKSPPTFAMANKEFAGLFLNGFYQAAKNLEHPAVFPYNQLMVFYTISADEALKKLHTRAGGLSTAEVKTPPKTIRIEHHQYQVRTALEKDLRAVLWMCSW